MLSILALDANAQVTVPEGTPIRAQLAEGGLTRATGGTVRLQVSEPVIISGAVVVERKAEIVAQYRGGKTGLTPTGVQSADGTWIELRPEPASSATSEQDYQFHTAKPAVIEARESLRFQPVDRSSLGYLRFGRWMLDLNRSWASILLDLGPSAICMVGFLLIGIGGLYRLSIAQRDERA